MTTAAPANSTNLVARGTQASIAVFKWFRSIRRYVQWFELMSITTASGARRRIRRAVGRKTPSVIDVRDFSSKPAYYEQLLDHLVQPDRLPLTQLERTQPGEATAIAAVARLAASAVIRTYCDVKKADPNAKAMRDQHAKQHACVYARFIVRDNLPSQFEVGVFRRGAVYDAIVRFSNAMGSRRSDRKSDGRGMAVKLQLKGTDLKNILPDLSGGRAPEQDFLMTNFPVFFGKDVADYTAFMKILALPTDGVIAKLRAQMEFIFFFVPWRLPQLWIFLAQACRKIDSPLRETYHSMTPYQLGNEKVVRYMARPLQTPAGLPPANNNQSSDNFLHDAMAAELDPRTHLTGEKAMFEFCVRCRGTPTQDDVEDASRTWEAGDDETVSLGRIEIPLQSFDQAYEVCTCENLSFNPWNAIPAHRPLGSLNRMRLAVYVASQQVRHRLNML
jgi:catalase